MNRTKTFEFSASFRWSHWIRALCITALTISGFYLAYVFISPAPSDEPVNFLHAQFRMWHIIFGFLLTCGTIFKLYLFLVDRNSARERISIIDFINPITWINQIKYYLFLGEHPKLKGVYNPLQFVAYLTVFILIFIEILTGFIMYVHVFHDGVGGALYNLLRPIEATIGGLAVVRQVHHLAMWGFLLFLPVHLYMAIFNSVKGKEGALDTIISGYKFEKNNH